MKSQKIHRRDAVKTLTVGSATLVPAWKLTAQSNNTATSPWQPKFLTTEQNKLVTTLAELIIPETNTPGARAAKVNEHIDLVLSDETSEVQQAFLAGLRWIDEQSRRGFNSSFLEASDNQQIELLTLVSKPEPVPPDLQPGRRFFRDIRRRTVFSYYTSRIGIHEEIEYKGKTPLAEWAGCTHPEHHDDDASSGDAE